MNTENVIDISHLPAGTKKLARWLVGQLEGMNVTDIESDEFQFHYKEDEKDKFVLLLFEECEEVEISDSCWNED